MEIHVIIISCKVVSNFTIHSIVFNYVHIGITRQAYTQTSRACVCVFGLYVGNTTTKIEFVRMEYIEL